MPKLNSTYEENPEKNVDKTDIIEETHTSSRAI